MKLLNQYRNLISHTDYCFHKAEQRQYDLLRPQLEWRILHETERGVSDERYADHDIVVSLTTYSKRLYSVALTIESLMEQTMKANRIILWLAEDELEDRPLPRALSLLERRGLEIRFCPDYRSFKKLVPSLLLCPEDTVITYDDDMLLPYDALENLIVPHLSRPDIIYSHRAHRMTFDERGRLRPYNEWRFTEKHYEPSFLTFPTGGGGTLYPAHSLAQEVTRAESFMKLCPTADDIWFKAMALLNDTPACSCFSHSPLGNEFFSIPDVQDIGLYHENVTANQRQLEAVFAQYDLYKKLKPE